MRDVLPFREKTSSLHDARHTLLVTFAETVLDRHLSRYASIHEIHCSSISKTTVPEPYPSFRWVVWVGLSITSSSAIDCHTAPVLPQSPWWHVKIQPRPSGLLVFQQGEGAAHTQEPNSLAKRGKQLDLLAAGKCYVIYGLKQGFKILNSSKYTATNRLGCWTSQFLWRPVSVHFKI